MTGITTSADTRFPPVSSALRPVVGFWGPNGEATSSDVREKWVKENLYSGRVQRLVACQFAIRCVSKSDHISTDAISYCLSFADIEQPSSSDLKKLESVALKTNEIAVVYAGEDVGFEVRAVCTSAAAASAYAGFYPVDERLIQQRLLSLYLPMEGWESSWETDTARGVAAQIYVSQDWSVGAILADALQDVGCEHWILEILRDQHAATTLHRGQWWLDKLTGRI